MSPAGRRRRASAVWYADTTDDLVTTPLTLAELEYFAARRAGAAARAAFRHDVRQDAYGVRWWNAAGLEAVEIAERYAELGVSLTDASLVALRSAARNDGDRDVRRVPLPRDAAAHAWNVAAPAGRRVNDPTPR